MKKLGDFIFGAIVVLVVLGFALMENAAQIHAWKWLHILD